MPTPQPYDPAKCKNIFWKPEPFDNLVPEGWISDLVLASRPLETPTIFAIWAGLWGISSAIKRGAWVVPVDFAEPMYPNMYVSLVGPPRIVGKSTIVGIITRILRESNQFITDPQTRADRRPNIVLSRTTSVGLLSDRLIVPDTHALRTPVRLDDGSIYTPPGFAQGAIVASELQTLVGKQSYLEDLVGNLTDLYDSKDTDELTTKARGTEVLEQVYITLFGATTRRSLMESFPASAFGDGFLSRMVLVAAEQPTRIYSDPQIVDPAPDSLELSQRLAWVIENAKGLYAFDDEASALWRKLYVERREDLIENLYDPDRSVDFRWDIHLRKVSLLVRASRYEEGTTITRRDLEVAVDLIDATLDRTRQILRGVGVPEQMKNRERIAGYLRNHAAGITRRKLSNYTSRDMKVNEMNSILLDLLNENQIKVFIDGAERDRLTKTGSEVYRWVA